ncbi:MAG TPA: tetratricopeptide repeat protein [Longimicrobiaceae bacterium]|nr:tetratricopeptide repeat protein [Longimicrobiaceae bacterium]
MKYNPAFLGDEELIRSFVARNAELETILGIIRENTAGSNQHLLIIGPRGIGKTTLVLRSAAEVRANPELAARWHPIVFGEETYEANSPGEFWLEALFHLGQQTGEARWQGAYEELRRERDEARLRGRVLAQLMDFADEQDKRLVLVVENLNMLVGEQLDRDDAWALRHTLMNEPRLMLLGTATSRFREMEYNQALYELFRIIELEPLGQEDAQALWTAATGQGITARRLRPLQILTGGNPRLIRILSEFAANTSFQFLMNDLTRLVDEHTEYFKHHLDNLPPQERKVFVALADLWDPSTARKVAEAARLDVNVTSALLKRLEERGAVTAPYKRGRAQYYQVAERMYNIYHLMRRRGPAASRVHAVVRFMVSLYRDEELVRTTRSLVEEVSRLTEDQRREHFIAYEAILSHARAPRLMQRLIEETRYAFETMPDVPESLQRLIGLTPAPEPDRETGPGAPDRGTLLTLRVEDVEDTGTLLRIAGLLSGQPGRLDEAEAAFRKALRKDPRNASAWRRFALLLGDRLRRHEEALESYDRALALEPDDAITWYNRGIALGYLGRHQEAQEANDRALALDPKSVRAWTSRGALLTRLGRHEEALESYDRVLALDPESVLAWSNRGVALGHLGRHEEALESYDRALALNAEHAKTWSSRGIALGRLGRHREALESFDRALELDPGDAATHLNRGLLYRVLKRPRDAEDDLRRAIALGAEGTVVSTALVGLLLEDLQRPDEALAAARESLERSGASAGALNSMARAFFRHGRREDLAEAESWSRRAVELAPGSGLFRHTLACLLGAQGKWRDALEEAAVFLADRDLLTTRLDEVIDFFIDAVAAGHGEEVARLIQASGTVETLEPLMVAIRRLTAAQVDVAREILEVAADVVQRIEARRQASRGG